MTGGGRAGGIGPKDARLERVTEARHAAELLRAYEPADAEQRATRERILAFLAEHPDALDRSCLAGHLTGSALVVDPDRRILLVLHRKLDRWLQPGGHCDGDANLPAVALREAIEESGIPDLVVVPEILDLDIHTIPARPAEPEHLHLDVRYLVLAPRGAQPVASAESRDVRWFGAAGVAELALDASLGRLIRHLDAAAGPRFADPTHAETASGASSVRGGAE